MERKSIFVVLMIISVGQCVIYRLNESEYQRMPPINHLDGYDECLHKEGDEYCTVHFDLVSDIDSEVLSMIQDYSQNTKTNYNHTRLRYGICVKKKCNKHINGRGQVRNMILEECLNETFWGEYTLKTRVNKVFCREYGDNIITLDKGDILVAVIYAIIIFVNSISSFYDFWICSEDFKGNSYLICFSIKRNWQILTASRDSHPRLKLLKSFDGLRSIIFLGVLVAHSLWPFMFAAENCHAMELVYYSHIEYILINGTLLIQWYLLIGGLFLMYNALVYSESRELSWLEFPKGIIRRWLRLLPAYSIVVATMATWLKVLATGPLWEESAGIEMKDCRNRWWYSLLFINNWLRDSQCLPQTWYLAVDFQLYCVGLLACIVTKTKWRRTALLTSSSIAGLVIPAVVTYYFDLDAILISSPGSIRTFFGTDRTYHELYIKPYTNLLNYVIGMTLGYLIYYWQKTGANFDNYKKYRYIYWLIIPAAIFITISSRVFYLGPRSSLLVRVLSATFIKPVLSMLFALFVIGLVFKLEDKYRSVLEWNGWVVSSRLSYCMFIVHFPVIRYYSATRVSLLHITHFNMLTTISGIIFWTFLTALPLWLLVESPINRLVKEISKTRSKNPNTVSSKIENVFIANQ